MSRKCLRNFYEISRFVGKVLGERKNRQENKQDKSCGGLDSYRPKKQIMKKMKIGNRKKYVFLYVLYFFLLFLVLFLLFSMFFSFFSSSVHAKTPIFLFCSMLFSYVFHVWSVPARPLTRQEKNTENKRTIRHARKSKKTIKQKRDSWCFFWLCGNLYFLRVSLILRFFLHVSLCSFGCRVTKNTQTTKKQSVVLFFLARS